jgi:hypothetical protein
MVLCNGWDLQIFRKLKLEAIYENLYFNENEDEIFIA